MHELVGLEREKLKELCHVALQMLESAVGTLVEGQACVPDPACLSDGFGPVLVRVYLTGVPQTLLPSNSSSISCWVLPSSVVQEIKEVLPHSASPLLALLTAWFNLIAGQTTPCALLSCGRRQRSRTKSSSKPGTQWLGTVWPSKL